MFLLSTIKILTVGSAVVTSTSIWFFSFHELMPFPKEPITDVEFTVDLSRDVAESKTAKNSNSINSLPAADRLETRTGNSIEDDKLTPVDSYPNQGIYFNLTKDSTVEKIYLTVPENLEVSFALDHIETTKDQYQSFNNQDIKISFFKQGAWYTQDGNEEYGEQIGYSEITDLFSEIDAVKVKQLLLSLHNNLEWKKDSENIYYQYVKYPESLEDLKNLKIKHFKDADALKTYVKEKVNKSCKEDTKACIPSPGELDYLVVDTREYFVDTWSKSY